MMNKLRSLLGITIVFLLLPLAGPGDALAVPVGSDGCEINAIGEVCTFGPKEFYVTNSGSGLDGQLFGEVGFEIEAVGANLWEYRYQVWMTDDPDTNIDDNFQLTKFRINFDPPVPTQNNGNDNIPVADFIPGGTGVEPFDGSGGNNPVTLLINPQVGFDFFVGYEALFDNPIDKGEHSAILRLQSPLGPTDQGGIVNGSNDFTDAFFSHIELIGLGVDGVVANFPQAPAPTVVPEPATILLLGSGLLGILAGVGFRRRSSASSDLNKTA